MLLVALLGPRHPIPNRRRRATCRGAAHEECELDGIPGRIVEHPSRLTRNPGFVYHLSLVALRSSPIV